MKFLYFFFILYSLAVLSAPAEVVTTDFDLNHDGKIDFSETTQDKILVNRKEDLDADGTFDRQTSFETDTSEMFFRVIEEKKTTDVPRSRSVSWVELGQEKIFTLTQIDQDNDGSWDKEAQESTDLYHKKKNCEVEDEISNLSTTVLEAASLSDEFESAPWGHQIHKSCLEGASRDWFLENTKQAMEEGLSCLSRLAGSGGTGAAKNHASLTNLLKQKNVQIICHGEKFDWSDTLAYATASKFDSEPLLKHPGISLNPRFKEKFKKKGKAGDLLFKRTIFHEQLHNLGYTHGNDIEYPYACEKCCFTSEKDSVKLKEFSCKVCSGNYKSKTDLLYVKEIFDFGQETGRNEDAYSAATRYLKLHKGDSEGSVYLALNLSDLFNPIGGLIAERLRTELKLSPAQLELAFKAEEFNSDPHLKPYKESAKILADAIYSAYVLQDPGHALHLLKKNAPLIKKQLSMKNSDRNSSFVTEELRKSIDLFLYDVLALSYVGATKDQLIKDNITKAAKQADAIYKVRKPKK